MDRAQFYKEVYSITKEIPYGNVFTYGKIAQLIGNPQYSRMVGQALSHAPKEEDLPCHRIVNSQGRLVPSWQKQKELLEKQQKADQKKAKAAKKKKAKEKKTHSKKKNSSKKAKSKKKK